MSSDRKVPGRTPRGIGVPDTLGDWVEHHGEPARRALVAYLGRERGEEAYAEALLQASVDPHGALHAADPVTYLFRAGRSGTRVRRRRLDLGRLQPVPNHLPEIEPELDAALATLTARQRTAVVLIVGWSWTFAEVAALLGISKGAVQRHHDRGLAHLRRHLGTDTGTSPTT